MIYKTLKSSNLPLLNNAKTKQKPNKYATVYHWLKLKSIHF